MCVCVCAPPSSLQRHYYHYYAASQDERKDLVELFSKIVNDYNKSLHTSVLPDGYVDVPRSKGVQLVTRPSAA